MLERFLRQNSMVLACAFYRQNQLFAVDSPHHLIINLLEDRLEKPLDCLLMGLQWD